MTKEKGRLGFFLYNVSGIVFPNSQNLNSRFIHLTPKQVGPDGVIGACAASHVMVDCPIKSDDVTAISIAWDRKSDTAIATPESVFKTKLYFDFVM